MGESGLAASLIGAPINTYGNGSNSTAGPNTVKHYYAGSKKPKDAKNKGQ